MGSTEESNYSSLCRASCGFYGSPKFEGYCSKCFKDVIERKQAQPSTSSSSLSPHGIGMGTKDAAHPATEIVQSNDIDTGRPTIAAHCSNSSNNSARFGDDTPSSKAPLSTEVAVVADRSPLRVPSVLDDSGSSTPNKSSEMKSADTRSPRKKIGCHICKIRLPPAAQEKGKCRCGGLFCDKHRHSKQHNCQFDYKSTEREQLGKSAVKCDAQRIPQI